jgi:hypothetical protein
MAHPEQTISRLIAVRDTQDVAGAVKAVEGGVWVEGGEIAHSLKNRWQDSCYRFSI